MKRFIAVISLILSLSLALCACARKAGGETEDASDVTEETVLSGDSTHGSDNEETDATGDTKPSKDPTDPTDPTVDPLPIVDPDDTEDVDVDEFMDDNFGEFDEDGGYEFKNEVGGKPVTEFGVFDEDGDGETYVPGEPNAPDTHDPIDVPPPSADPDSTDPDPTDPDPTDPDPTDPEHDPATEPSEDPTESGTDPEPGPDPEPVPPKDSYATAISLIDDYTADVKFVCEVELSDGSVTKYVYKYRVNKSGDDYSADYTEAGKNKTASFCASDGVMNVNGSDRSADLSDFYRFCSMIEPLHLGLYYYEHSEAGTDVSTRLKGEDYRSLLLNTSLLFTGFESMDGITMGSFYVNGHIDPDGVYTGGKFAYDMSLVDSILGEMKFRVAVEVNYVY